MAILNIKGQRRLSRFLRLFGIRRQPAIPAWMLDLPLEMQHVMRRYAAGEDELALKGISKEQTLEVLRGTAACLDARAYELAADAESVFEEDWPDPFEDLPCSVSVLNTHVNLGLGLGIGAVLSREKI